MEFKITKAKYDCSRDLLLINSENGYYPDIIDGESSNSNYSYFKIYKVKDGEYQSDEIRNCGIYLVGHNSVMQVRVENQCICNDLTPIDLDPDRYIRPGGTGITCYYEFGKYFYEVNGLSNTPFYACMFGLQGYGENGDGWKHTNRLLNENTGYALNPAYEGVVSDWCFYIIDSRGCIYGRYIHKTEESSIKGALKLEYDCKNGINYRERIANLLLSTPKLPKIGSKLPNGNNIFKVRLNNNLPTNELLILNNICAAFEYYDEVFVNCKNNPKIDDTSKVPCKNIHELVSIDISSDACLVHIKNISKYNLGVSLTRLLSSRGACEGIKMDGDIANNPRPEEILPGQTKSFRIVSFGYDNLLTVVYELYENGEYLLCELPFCLPNCEFKLIDDTTTLKTPSITRHYIEDEPFLLIKNYNNVSINVVLESNGVIYSTEVPQLKENLLQIGYKDFTFKIDYFADNGEINSYIDSFVEESETPVGLFYYINKNGIINNGITK